MLQPYSRFRSSLSVSSRARVCVLRPVFYVLRVLRTCACTCVCSRPRVRAFVRLRPGTTGYFRRREIDMTNEEEGTTGNVGNTGRRCIPQPQDIRDWQVPAAAAAAAVGWWWVAGWVAGGWYAVGASTVLACSVGRSRSVSR